MAEYTDESFTKDEWEKQQKKSTPAASVLPGAQAVTAAPSTELKLPSANQSIADFAKESETEFNTTVADWAKKGAPLLSQAKPDTRTKKEKVIDWASTPVGMTALAGGGLGLAALLAAAVSGNSKEGTPTLRDRSITNPPGGGGGPSSGPLPESGFSMSRGTGAPEESAAFQNLFERATGQTPAAETPAQASTSAEPTRMERAATRIQEGQARGLGAQPAGSAAPELPPNPRMVAVPNPNATSQWDQYLYVPETEVARAYPAPILNEGALSVAPPAATPTQTVAPSATPEPEITGKAGAAITPTEAPEAATTEQTKKRGRPAGSPNLTPEQRSMQTVGKQAEGARNWLMNTLGNDPVAYEEFINKYRGGKEYPNVKEAYRAIEDHLGGPLRSEFMKAQEGQIAGTQRAFMGPIQPKAPAANAPTGAALSPQAKGQQGFVLGKMPTELTPIGQGAANFGRQLTGDLKMGAAALPFMFATDVRQQNVGYERELRNEMAKTKDPARQAELQGELGKLEEQRYLKAMYDRFVKQSVPAPYRPALTR